MRTLRDLPKTERVIKLKMDASTQSTDPHNKKMVDEQSSRDLHRRFLPIPQWRRSPGAKPLMADIYGYLLDNLFVRFTNMM